MKHETNILKIRKFIDEHYQKGILCTGIGNVLKKDDGAGVYICHKIKENDNICSLIVEVCIENYLKPINLHPAQTVLLLDVVDINRKPGYFDLLSVHEIRDYTTNTHNISLKRISEFIQKEVFILGIQPADVSFGEGLTPEIKKSADSIIDLFHQAR